MSEIGPNGQAVLHLETELPQGIPGEIVTVRLSVTQTVKYGSYLNGQLAANGREHNTAKVMRWSN